MVALLGYSYWVGFGGDARREREMRRVEEGERRMMVERERFLERMREVEEIMKGLREMESEKGVDTNSAGTGEVKDSQSGLRKQSAGWFGWFGKKD